MADKITTCANEKCDTPHKAVFARGLCQPCYYLFRRTGSFERQRRPNNPGALCSEEGCGRKTHSKGLCMRHYQRQIPKAKAAWKILRSRAYEGYPPEWDDYAVFAEIVGEPPAPTAQLRRPDPSMPWSCDNVEWVMPVGATEDFARYQWAWNLRRAYGLTVEEAELIIKHQAGKCPACDKPLGVFGPSTRKDAVIIVDHDHFADGRPKREAVRGLMHRVCNSGMGQLGDDPANCRRAADHLERHVERTAIGLSIVDQILNKGEV